MAKTNDVTFAAIRSHHLALRKGSFSVSSRFQSFFAASQLVGNMVPGINVYAHVCDLEKLVLVDETRSAEDTSCDSPPTTRNSWTLDREGDSKPGDWVTNTYTYICRVKSRLICKASTLTRRLSLALNIEMVAKRELCTRLLCHQQLLRCTWKKLHLYQYNIIYILYKFQSNFKSDHCDYNIGNFFIIFSCKGILYIISYEINEKKSDVLKGWFYFEPYHKMVIKANFTKCGYFCWWIMKTLSSCQIVKFINYRMV